MRVLVLMPDNLSKPTGGLGVQLNHIIKHSDGIEWDIVAQPDENPRENYTQVLNPLTNIQHASLITAVCQTTYFAESIKRPKPDIVHAYDWSTFFGGYYAAKHFNVPLVVTMQLSINLLNQAGITYTNDINSPDGYWINQVHCEMEKFGLFNADKIIHVSNGYAKRFIGVEQKSCVIHNGIDLKDWENFNIKKLPGKGKIKLVYIGRMASMKNVQAVTKTKVPKNIDLIFVGNDRGGERNVFDAMMEFVNNNQNVHYYGESFGQDKIDLLNNADAMIVPSIHEPFGIVGLEGLASKSIVLSSRVDGLGDFLNEQNSIFCGISPETIEESYKKLSSMSDKQKNKMINNGLKTLKDYSWKSAADKTKKVYQEALESFNSSSVNPLPLNE